MSLVPKRPVAFDISMLTTPELAVVQRAGDVATAFATLPELHPADRDDVAFHVHAIQNLVLARCAYPRNLR